jgi:hypothetical protein
LALNILVSVFSHHVDTFLAQEQAATLSIQRINNILASRNAGIDLKTDAVAFLISVFCDADSMRPIWASSAEPALAGCFNIISSQNDAGSSEMTSSLLKLVSCLLQWNHFSGDFSASAPSRHVKVHSCANIAVLSSFIKKLGALIHAESSPAQLKADAFAVIVGVLNSSQQETIDHDGLESLLANVSDLLRDVSLTMLSSKLSPDLRELTLSLSKVRIIPGIYYEV